MCTAAALALAAGAVPAAAQQQIGVSPPTRSDLAPPELRREERPVTLTVDGDFERPACALDRPDF
ncbi:MAG TPA: hypothetical protein VI407_07275, partial [Erythrobacter sp.]